MPPSNLPSGFQRVETPKAPALRGPNFPIGKLTYITCSVEPTYVAFLAQLSLKDPLPDEPTTVYLFTSEPRLQSLLQMSLANGDAVTCWGPQLAEPPPLEGYRWPPGSIVYNLAGITTPSQP